MIEKIKITQEDKAKFNRDGYWISPKLITDDQIEKLRAAHDRIWSGDFDGDGYPMHPVNLNPDPKRLRKQDNGWWINNDVRNTVTDPYIGELAADLLEVDSIRLWHDQMIYKPGLGGEVSNVGNVGWHQDFGYWQCSDNMNMMTVWIALQDTDLTNGGMMTILGSHKWGLIPDSNTFFDQNLDILREKYSAEGHEWIEEPCILKAGQASFHHALTFHGSGPNLTTVPRLSTVAHLMPGGTGYHARVMNHDNVKFLGPRPVEGQKFDNDFFPLVYSRP
ncbi:phytanoyl-CoA dioxygenase family protein [Paenibacillus psychroresistens]|uniref:Phytanoyl-CoA dioxygenase family protein n=1 Tax=Paenibacillus psychroresistens TaxID=1778678 RepID=A0A6B8RS83_9BACL|nr:phytanoyl-CoA dioxygenase family protein [Paenibacillus psychroresistens]QGQ98196.1 phytanoyl-CoA dioxygenase family protein [Paenibacillus psychroresistens]